MFTKAYTVASAFTLPVVISSRSDKGVCNSAIGACVVVNRGGWVLTTAHLMAEIQRQQESVGRYGTYGDGVRQLEQDTVADKRFRKTKVRSIARPAKGGITNHSVWWGRDGAQLCEVAVMAAADLALGRIEPFDGDSVAHYPVFKTPDDSYAPGRSLCKLGFPFHGITPVFDEKKNAFMLPAGAVPLPIFPIDGIFTRVVAATMPGQEKSGEVGKFIETSSPGLVGQSGGPTVDADGAVWALQSHTRHHPLGFSPPVPGAGGGHDKNAAQTEHQFLNVGMGVHAEVILSLLENRGVVYQST